MSKPYESEKNNPTEKQAKIMNRQFTEKEI